MKHSQRMTHRQAAAWPQAVAEVQRHAQGSTVPTRPEGWVIHWHEETRAGRGRMFEAMWMDGEHAAQIIMDVYGYPAVTVSAVEVLHNSSNDECPCPPCEAERNDDEDTDR